MEGKCKYCGIDFVKTNKSKKYCSKVCRETSDKESDKARNKVYQKLYPEKIMHQSARRRAQLKGLVFEISVEDITIPEFCPILGIPLVSAIGGGRRGGERNSPSLDRIDNNLGYTKENIQVISTLANAMKSSASPEELIKFAEWILEEYKCRES